MAPHLEAESDAGRHIGWKEARDGKDPEEVDDQNWCPMPLATRQTHANFFRCKHPVNMAVYKAALQKQLRGSLEERTSGGLPYVRLPPSGGVPLAQLADTVRKHDDFLTEEHVLEAALSLCGGVSGSGKPLFCVGYQRTRSTPRVPSNEWLLSQGCSIWLVEGYTMETWPPLAIRRAILEEVREVPRGWCPEALRRSHAKRVLDLRKWRDGRL